MRRNILLVEPGYKTKFPPLGLMKISSYHKKLGDNVKFVKGIDKNIPYENIWHRIYISTVFTYHWKVTVGTIKYYKSVVSGDISRIKVGGIMASLMPEELWKETGVVPVTGLLSEPGMLGDNNENIVEDMIPDYELFDNKNYISDDQGLENDVDYDNSKYEYSLVNDCYFGYLTRGCIRACEFCGVHTLEPEYIEYKGIKPYIEEIKKRYGEKCHLVLFDNNVLASKRLDDIVNDLKELGFEKGSMYEYKKNGRTIKKQRHVDFNQGIDARLMTIKKTKLLAELAIHPLRIAFDDLKFKDLYIKKVQLAAKYGIHHLSNYILYNFNDTPRDLWKR